VSAKASSNGGAIRGAAILNSREELPPLLVLRVGLDLQTRLQVSAILTWWDRLKYDEPDSSVFDDVFAALANAVRRAMNDAVGQDFQSPAFLTSKRQIPILVHEGASDMSYIDGFVIPVPSGERERYRAAAQKFHEKFKDCGAIRQVECWGDDVPEGKVTDFKRAVAAKPGETVVSSWIEWPSKEVRDAANKKMMEDPEMKNMDMPFDGKRMIFGGFEVIFDTAPIKG
jgi:uncharacterized protein YbaA (DUF1428 family)